MSPPSTAERGASVSRAAPAGRATAAASRCSSLIAGAAPLRAPTGPGCRRTEYRAELLLFRAARTWPDSRTPENAMDRRRRWGRASQRWRRPGCGTPALLRLRRRVQGLDARPLAHPDRFERGMERLDVPRPGAKSRLFTEKRQDLEGARRLVWTTSSASWRSRSMFISSEIPGRTGVPADQVLEEAGEPITVFARRNRALSASLKARGMIGTRVSITLAVVSQSCDDVQKYVVNSDRFRCLDTRSRGWKRSPAGR